MISHHVGHCVPLSANKKLTCGEYLPRALEFSVCTAEALRNLGAWVSSHRQALSPVEHID